MRIHCLSFLLVAAAFLGACSDGASASPTTPQDGGQKSDVGHDSSASDATGPDGSKPDVSVSDSSIPDSAASDVERPEVSTPDSSADALPVDAAKPDASVPDSSTPDSSNPKPDASSPPIPGVVGLAGIDAWDALSKSERDRVNGFRSFFLHQSVGGDLEDGAEAIGYKFEWVASGSTKLRQGLNGGLFNTSNGNASGKIDEFETMAVANKGTLRVAIMKFGYADIESSSVAAAQTRYKTAVDNIKAAGVRVLHVTPPLVYKVPEKNAPKMQMRTWMIATFKDDIIFDLEDVESTDPSTGTRCERGGSWEICDRVRSTSSCPSKEQGIDGASGQGHICFDPHAQRFARAFLYAIYLAGK